MDKAWDIEREQNRSTCYKLFAACFYEPDFEVFMGENLFSNLAVALRSFSQEASGVAEKMIEEFSPEHQEAIAVAHAKLFIGPFELSAPPYGSIYLEQGNRMMGDTSIAVQKMYQSTGLKLRDEMKEAPDHIAFELEYMHFLCDTMINSFTQGDMTEASEMLVLQHEFSQKYLSQWVAPLCDRITENAEHEFYRLLGKCLMGFFKSVTIPEALQGQMQK